MNVWKKENCSIKPLVFEKTKDSIIQRRNITKNIRFDENNIEIISYDCEIRFLNQSEYQEIYIADLENAILELAEIVAQNEVI